MKNSLGDDLRALWRRLVVALTTSGGVTAPSQSAAPYAYFFYQVATTYYSDFVANADGTVDRLVQNETVKSTIKQALSQGPGGYDTIKTKLVAESQASGYPVWICIWIVR